MANGCSSTPSRAGALRELRGAREAVLFAYVSAFASTVPLLMRLPLPRLAALLTRRPARRRRPAAAVQRLDALVALAQGVAPCVRGGCLTRGVTLFWFLRRAGIDVELCFGLDPAAGEAAADGHCWLVHNGEPFLERADPRTRFAEIFRLPVERT